VEGPVRPLLEKIILVFRRSADRRIPLAPRHAREPRLDVLGLERRFDRGIPGVGERIVVGPRRLFQIKGAAMADAAAIGVREPTPIEKLRCQTRGVEAAERRLGMCGVREAKGPDPAVAPILPHQPGESVVSVLGLAQIFRETTRRLVTAAAILITNTIP